MKEVNTYLSFDGNCREAMTFYQKCFSGELETHSFADMPNVPPEAKDWLMHARVIKDGKTLLMASDGLPERHLIVGNNFSVSVQCDSDEEIERLFKAFTEKGEATMPLANQFWGAKFGMIKDDFGVNWMFNYELPRS